MDVNLFPRNKQHAEVPGDLQARWRYGNRWQIPVIAMASKRGPPFFPDSQSLNIDPAVEDGGESRLAGSRIKAPQFAKRVREPDADLQHDRDHDEKE